MSKIYSVTPERQKNSRNISRNQRSKFSFNGTLSSTEKPLTKAQEFLVDKALNNKYLGAKGWALNKLSATAGEIQNLVVIGLGTAFVAPFFIAHNPLSKEDKKSRTYTAWRQPISAVIGTAAGLATNLFIPGLVERQVVKDKFEAFKLADMPPKDFLKARYKGIQKHFNKMGKLDKEYFDMVNDGSIKTVNDFKSESKFPQYTDFMAAVHKSTLDRAAKTLLDAGNPQGLPNITLKDFLIKNMKFENDYVNKNLLNNEATETKMAKMNAMDFLRQLGYSNDEINEKSMRTFINTTLYKDRVRFNPHEKKYMARVAETLISSETRDSETISLKYLLKALKIDDDFAKNEKLLNTKMSDFLSWLDKNMDIQAAVTATKRTAQNNKVTSHQTTSEILHKRARQIAKITLEKASKNYDAYKNVQGIVLTLFMLPFSCGLLNWAYPRIMEKYFPELIKQEPNNKAAKGGS